MRQEQQARRARRAGEWFFRLAPMRRCVILLLLPYSLYGIVCIVSETV